VLNISHLQTSKTELAIRQGWLQQLQWAEGICALTICTLLLLLLETGSPYDFAEWEHRHQLPCGY
jgi:hypothetical protein